MQDSADRRGFGAGSDFMPAIWDPIHHLGAEFTRGVLANLEAKVLEAMGILREVCGAPRVEAGDPGLAAFCFVLTKSLVDGSPLPTDRARLFVQAVAATLYHGRRGGRDADPRSFYAYLVDRCREYAQVYHQRQGDRKLVYIVKHFLGGYGLGDPEDFDLAVSIQGLIQPDLGRGARILAAAAEQDLLAEGLPLPAHSPPVGRDLGVLRSP